MTRCPKCGQFAKDLGLHYIVPKLASWVTPGGEGASFTTTTTTVDSDFRHFILCSKCGEVDPP